MHYILTWSSWGGICLVRNPDSFARTKKVTFLKRVFFTFYFFFTFLLLLFKKVNWYIMYNTSLFLPLINNAISSKKPGLKENKLLNTNCLFLHLRSWAPLNICVHLVQFISLSEILQALFIAPKMLKARFFRKTFPVVHARLSHLDLGSPSEHR